MKRSFRGLATFVGGAALVAFACFTGPNCQPSGGSLGGSSGNGDGGNSSGGTSSGSGGSSSGGNNNSTGGNSSGGTSSSGGSSASSSGGKASGGSSSSSSGGTSSSNGGTTTSSSSGSSGGAVSAGGSSTASSSGGGTTGTGSGPTGTTVTIANGKGVGAMVGYGWVSLGSADTLTDPKCGTAAITSAAACTTTTTWSTTNSLCISGSIPALPASPTSSDYSTNWGVSIGLNATDPAGGTLAQAFSSVAITVTGTPTSGLRAQVHVKGDPDGTSYCYNYASGAMPLAKFAQDCYNTTPTLLIAASAIGNIDKVMIQVSSAATAITVTNLCITGITFSN